MKHIKNIALIILSLYSFSLVAQIDSGYVEVKKAKIFYRIWGEGEPLVFLNGGPGFSSAGYESYGEALSEHRQVILFDQRGTGKSYLKNKKNRNVYISHMVKDLEKLRGHLNIDKWDVLGHSFGGRYAMHYAAKYPGSIKKMIISAAPVLSNNLITHAQYFEPPKVESLTASEIYYYQLLLTEKSKVGRTSQKELKKLDMALKARYYVNKPENYPKVADWFYHKYESVRPLSVKLAPNQVEGLKRKLHQFQQPVLIIHGISDFLNVANPIENDKLFPNSRIEFIYDSGHIMLVDQRDNYVGTIEYFLNENN